ncbi:MAG: acyl-CoA synthetase FdrA [Spirochaetota bacterium]|nr:acyl-CoA synthetase FdrA [Spirochaetota bacterium]
MDKVLIQKDSYFDSVFLMLINSEIKEHEGVSDAVVAMGTEMNLKLLSDMKLHDPGLEGLTPNDLIIAVRGDREDKLETAISAAMEMLTKKAKKSSGRKFVPRTLGAALRENPDANMVLISLPGQYAAREARKALENGLHVMLFSDNVSLDEEVELKKLAVEKGLLMMGPDCGTAIINGVPLCFANVVKRGPIGVVGASGTGLQEVTCLIDKFDGGISQAIGTGGRDLKNEQVGGRMMLLGIEALRNDDATSVIVVISKPPAPEVADTVLAALKKSGKPAVIHFIGMEISQLTGPEADEKAQAGANIQFASNLEETARMAVALAEGKDFSPAGYSLPAEQIQTIINREIEGISPKQKYLRGLYTGGTLADESLILLEKALGRIYSNNQGDEDLQLKDPHTSVEHTIVDLGDDIYTVGRAHPMIDPSTRVDRLKSEAEDPEVAVLLLDIVLGYGSHKDPAGAILPALEEAREKAAARGGYLPVITSVTGTTADFQGFERTVEKLESIGCIVMPSNYQAARLTLDLLGALGKKRGE